MKTQIMLLAACVLLGACGFSAAPPVAVAAQHGQIVIRSHAEKATCVLPIGGGAATVETRQTELCVACSITDAENITDDDPDSFAALSMTLGPTVGYIKAGLEQTEEIFSYLRITASAQPGIVFPAGNIAGAFLSFGDEFTLGTAAVVFTTLAGKFQEQVLEDSQRAEMVEPGVRSFVGIQTTRPFDAVSVAISPFGTSVDGNQDPVPAFLVGPNASHMLLQVHEVCAGVVVE